MGLGQRQQLSMRQSLRQELTMGPQLILSLKLLQVPLITLQERIDQELLENPMLEQEELEQVSSEERPDQPEDRKADERVVEGEDFAKLDNLADDFRDYFYQASSRAAPAEKDEKLEALANTAGRGTTLQDHLAEQVRFLELDEDLRDAVEYLAHNLDRDGYLRDSIEELAAGFSRADEGLMERALRTLQSLDPPGVGARDLKECLLLQLDGMQTDTQLVERMIQCHLEDIQKNRLPKIARETERTIEEVKEAQLCIQTLDPSPGSAFDTETVGYVLPDLVVEYVDGRYEVSLNDRYTPRLRVNHDIYHSVRKSGGTSGKEREYIKERYNSANWFVNAIKQRRNTLLKVAREIVRAQHDFFEHGLGSLKPLKMQEVADATDMHVTTVSRAAKGKYMQTPRGIFPLKYFFSGGVRTGQGESESYNAIKQRIVEIVDKEDKSKPLSDDDIVKELERQGVDLARRTVTKYRKALNIPSSRQRKEY